MAEPGSTIDPNDLDSIDALLDEAELEAAEEEEPTVEELSESNTESMVDAPDNDSKNNDEELDTIPETPPAEEPEEEVDEDASDDVADAKDDSESVEDDLNNLDEDFGVEDPAEKESDSNQKIEEEVSISEPEPKANFDEEPIERGLNKPEKPDVTEDLAERILQKRASVQKKEPSNLTVAEMDSIKKLIIIFSSTIIVLVVTAIGIGLWGALSSSSSLDDETMTLIKDTHEGAMQSMVKSASTEEVVKQVGKKLDALSFQLEQLNSDLVQVKEAVTVAPSSAKDSVAVLNLENEQAAPKSQAPASTNAPVVMDAGMGKKIDKVNAQVVVTQRRLAEVNNRVKQLQSQYKTFIKGLKELEKAQLTGQANINDLLEATKAQVKAEKLKQQAMEKSRYEYSAPNSPFFDYVR
ncbi:hypothetical protein CYQ88_03175 [Hydrogenovibrio sp. SC-1]|uniref:hypothetical protein n=1 Tax=Hydrogenovibrio sp. SC-1 TaxID=2065820 RepID=UPI000C7B8E56|nr:hypothetical protein [Hydrogenovibrio sp. SC-1]PLA74919.1 hypothetical protein CYQ88_03175 [Hydrogenovibrio sp. SC-1]